MTQDMTTTNRYFQVILNNNTAFPAYTVVTATALEAVRTAKKEAKANRNDSVRVIEVDENDNMLPNGYFSKLFFIK